MEELLFMGKILGGIYLAHEGVLFGILYLSSQHIEKKIAEYRYAFFETKKPQKGTLKSLWRLFKCCLKPSTGWAMAISGFTCPEIIIGRLVQSGGIYKKSEVIPEDVIDIDMVEIDTENTKESHTYEHKNYEEYIDYVFRQYSSNPEKENARDPKDKKNRQYHL